MPKLPQLSGREIVRALERAGFYVRRQKGSHIAMRRDQPFAQAIVPNHREVKPGTLRGVLEQAGISEEEFLKLL